MNQLLYKYYGHKDLSLRDYLAIERTSLANERTLLSYVRSMIGLAAVGGSLIKFFSDSLIVFSGWLLLSFAIIVLVVGFIRYVRIYDLIQHLQHSEDQTGFEGDHLQNLLLTALRKLHLSPIK